MTLKNTLNYSPQELNFGTSGLRGLETDMTDLECYINARGFIHFLESSHGLRKGGSIALAGDLRRSTPRILKAVASAITESGYITEYAGRIPTPALAYYALRSNIPSIMVTGSHIPADRNGIKFYRADSEVMKDDEASIKNSVTIVREEVYAQDSEASLFTPEGTLKNAVDLPDENTDVLNNFLERYTSVFPSTVFTQKHIIVYQHSAVGRDFLVTLLEKLGAKVTPVQRSETFISIDTENVTPADQENFRKIAAEYPVYFTVVTYSVQLSQQNCVHNLHHSP
jgi:phosphomannomutase